MEFTKLGIEVAAFPELGGREGFLATTSVLVMSVLLSRYGGQDVSPGTGLGVSEGLDLQGLRRWLVLTGPGIQCVSTDLETRLHELGAATVQVADHRNFAHGRHLGLSRNLSETLVVSLQTPELAKLAKATLGSLPAEAKLLEVVSEARWPTSAIELMCQSMRIAGEAARAAGVDPSHPRVPEFGRRLYHINASALVEHPPIDAVDRKITEAGFAPGDGPETDAYRVWLKRFLTSLRHQRFTGAVLDYDGTCCTTAGRFDLPGERLREELLRLLDAGLVVGFASGRGRSLHTDLRKWVPEVYWPRVLLGLYNGGLRVGLSDEIGDQTSATGVLAEVIERVRASPFGDQIEVDGRRFQVSLRSHALANPAGLSRYVCELVAAVPRLDVRVVSSAHAVDVILPGSSKIRVLDDVAELSGGKVLAIGDQGQMGGNDFDLLAATDTSLTVDRCSSDPSRCWNLDRWGMRGPDLLLKYLTRIELGSAGAHLVWRT